MKKLGPLSLLACCLSLTGCLLPRQYDAKLLVTQDAKYVFGATGDSVYLPVYAKYRDKPVPTAVEDEMRREVDKLSRMPDRPGSRSVYTHKGGWTVGFDVKEMGTFAKTAVSIGGKTPYITIAPQPGGTYRVQVAAIPEKDLAELRKMQVASAGKVCVVSEMKVLDHNADTVPTVPGGEYCWDMDMIAGDSLRMVLQGPASG